MDQCRPKETFGSGGIRTHALERTGALNQRLRPLGHATVLCAHASVSFPNVEKNFFFLFVQLVFQLELSTAIPCWTHQFSSDHWS